MVDVHVFWGLGATGDSVTKTSTGKYFSHCNPSLLKSIKHVALQCLSPFGPRLTKYLKMKKEVVRASLADPTVKKVYIIGHSYGGLAVNMMCKMLKNDPNARKKLYAITFGTIYRAKPTTLAGMRIRQYMYPDDVALRCQRIQVPARSVFNNRNNFNSQGFTWLKPTRVYKTPRRAVVWGTRNEWKIHDDYPIAATVRKCIADTMNNVPRTPSARASPARASPARASPARASPASGTPKRTGSVSTRT
jgi:hypothetical protein